MALKFGKSELSKVVECLEADHETVGDAAVAMLGVLETILEGRAKFAVVGQLVSAPGRPSVPPGDPEAIKVHLGFFSTEGDARKAAEGLWSPTASGDTFATWVVPVYHGTPAEFHAGRKAAYVAASEKATEKASERLQAEIAKRQAEAQARADWWVAPCLCGHERSEHRVGGMYGNHPKRDACANTGCPCNAFVEQLAAAA